MRMTLSVRMERVGELDATQLFYLITRHSRAARAMLIEAFLIDAIDGVEIDSLSQILRGVATQWMAQTGLTADGDDMDEMTAKLLTSMRSGRIFLFSRARCMAGRWSISTVRHRRRNRVRSWMR